VKRALILLFVACSLHPLFAEEKYGSKYRPDYEKEKNGPHGECKVRWTKMQPGLEYRTIKCLGDEDDLDLHVVRIDLDRWDLDTAVVNRATGKTIARNNDASFVLNANFFDASRKPLGAVVSSGEVVRGARDSSWQSIFLIDEDGKPRIILPSKWRTYREGAKMAVQAGPRLVIAGHFNESMKNNYSAARAGVCIRKNGQVLFFATPSDRKLHIREIGKVARRDEIDGGLACRDAMLFDGGHSVNFFVAGGVDRVSIEGDPVPVYVIATRHRENESSQAK
jgi:uncharacterized protein YigE (DUF2233 family)